MRIIKLASDNEQNEMNEENDVNRNNSKGLVEWELLYESGVGIW